MASVPLPQFLAPLLLQCVAAALVYLRIAAVAIALLLLHCILLFAAVLPLLLLRLLLHC